MPNRTISTKLAIDGEAEYKKAISEINSGMKVLRSEMSLAAAEFEGNADSVEALTRKGEILEREILTQREKVEAIRAALQNAAEAYGESDRRTMNWQVSLNRAEEDLIRMNRELESNREALEDAANATEEGQKKFSLFSGEAQGLGDVIDKLGGKFGVNLPSGIQESLNGLGKINPAAVAAAGGFTALVAAIAKTEDKLRDMALESAAYADEIMTNSLNTGLTEEALQEWNYAAELIDVSSETMQSSMAKLIRSMDSARGGDGSTDVFASIGVSIENAAGELRSASSVFYETIDALNQIENSAERDAVSLELFGKSFGEITSAVEKNDLNTLQSLMTKLTSSMDKSRNSADSASAAFDKLEVSYTNADGTLRDAEAVFYDVVDALGQIENGTERDATSMELFGKSAQDLNSLIVQGSDKLREYADEAHEMGYVLSEEDLAALGAVDDAQQRLLKTQEAVANQISTQYSPYMESALTMSRDLLKEVGDALARSGVVESLGSILDSTMSLLRPLAELGTSTLPIISTVLGGIAGFLALIADAANVVAGILTRDLDRIGVAMGYGTSSGRSSNMQRWMGTGAAGAAASGSYYNPATGMYEGNYYHNAGGTDNFPGGWSWVGENGPEQVFLPAGSVIATAQEARGAGGGDTFYITIDAANVREFNDIVEMARNARRMERMGGRA